MSDSVFNAYVADLWAITDANDLLYQVSASFDYDPGPGLESIRAPLIAINFEDDLINPPELRILEREIERVPNSRAIVVPASSQTRGHGTHTLAAVWRSYLEELLRISEKRKGRHDSLAGFEQGNDVRLFELLTDIEEGWKSASGIAFASFETAAPRVITSPASVVVASSRKTGSSFFMAAG